MAHSGPRAGPNHVFPHERASSDSLVMAVAPADGAGDSGATPLRPPQRALAALTGPSALNAGPAAGGVPATYTITPSAPASAHPSSQLSFGAADDHAVRLPGRQASLSLDLATAVSQARERGPARSPTRTSTSRLSRGMSMASVVSQVLGGEGVHEVCFPLADPATRKEKRQMPNYIRTTRYTLLTFLPLNLFRQIFFRYYNAYFTIAALTTISGNAALSWWSQVVPLVVVLTVTALKDAYEDFMRYKADRAANNSPRVALRQGGRVDLPTRSIRPGELLRLERGDKLPADCVLLSSEADDGTCFIETAELDGETNLKRKAALADLVHYNTDDAIHRLTGWVQCDLPNDNLNVFNGKLVLRQFAGALPKPASEGTVELPPVPTPVAPHPTKGHGLGAAMHRRPSTQSHTSSIMQPSPHQGTLGTLDRVRVRMSLGRRASKVPVDRDATTFALGMNQFLPRGAVIRNIAYVYAVVVYAGHDTKIMRNLKSVKTKASRLERELNYYVLGIFGYNIFLIVSSMALEYVQWNNLRNNVNRSSLGQNSQFFYADDSWLNVSTASHLGTSFLSFFSLYTYVVPISLFVTMEIVRFLQGRWMTWDEQMQVDRVDDITGDVETVSMRANNTNLNEELGSVDYIFSDKTGTLTQNKMTADKWFVDGLVHDEKGSPGCLMAAYEKFRAADAQGATRPPAAVLKRASHFYSPTSPTAGAPDDADAIAADNLGTFMRAIALCNAAIPTPHEKTGAIIYESQSPDETALLVGMEQNRVRLAGRHKGTVTISFNDTDEQYTLLRTLEFTSDRKRMSVILRAPNGVLQLFCKGADNLVFERLEKSADINDPEEIRLAQRALDEFAATGLRTLAVAGRVLDEDEYTRFSAVYSEAEQALENRENRIADACELVERNLELLGCTAIEDRLQDQVPETIAYLRECQIKLWLLTGDKLETAINIGFSSQFIDREMRLFILGEEDAGRSKELLLQWIDEIQRDRARAAAGAAPVVAVADSAAQQAARNEANQRELPPRSSSREPSAAPTSASVASSEAHEPKKYGLVVVGHVLVRVWDDKLQDLLVQLGVQCHSVICCRVTPLQKANVVKLVRDHTKAITLAIGDGANDVSMIQSASIGVGIIGREGSQAQRASDYAFGEFRFLARLLAVHGRYSYMRFAKLIYYSFYKNFALITVQWIFNFYNAWTASLVYDEIFMTLYNVIFTSIPPVVLACFELDVIQTKIVQYPRLYAEVRGRLYWHWRLFVTWLSYALATAAILYFFIFLAIGEGAVAGNGLSLYYGPQTIVFSTSILLTVLLCFALVVRRWVWWTIGSIIVCIAIDVLVMFILPYLSFTLQPTSVYIVHSIGVYYLLILLVPVASNLTGFSGLATKRIIWPTDADIITEEAKVDAAIARRFKPPAVSGDSANPEMRQVPPSAV